MSDLDSGRATRRHVLTGGLAVAALALASPCAWGQQKAAQKIVQYQDKPKGAFECDKCLHFVAPDSCKLVEGKINPKGWCQLFVPKPK